MKWSRYILPLVLLLQSSLLSDQTNTTFYCKGGSIANLSSNWNTTRSGDGSDLLGFTGEYNTYVIQAGQSISNNAQWTIGGSGATLIVEDGAALTAPYLIVVPYFEIQNGGTYIHSVVSAEINGTISDIPGTVTRTFAANSNQTFLQWANGGSVPVALPYTYSWGNLTIDVASLGGNWVNAGFDYGRIYGDLIIENTGGGSHEFIFNGTTRIYGTLHVHGGILTLSNSSTGGTVYFQTSEGINHTGGVMKTTGSDIVELNIGSGDSLSSFFSIGGSSFVNTNINYFTAGKCFMLFSDLPIAASRQLVTQSNIDCGIYALKGEGSINLGQRICIGSPDGITATGAAGNIQVTGGRVFQAGSVFVYNGSAAQYGGNGIPSLVDTLVIDNANGVTLSGNIAIDDRLILQNGNLYTGPNTLTLNDRALLTGEIAGRSVVGTLLSDMRMVGSVGNQLGNIGVELDPYSAIISLSVERKSGSIGIVSANGQEGIARRWKFTIWNGYYNTSADVSVTLSWISDDDNSKNVTSMRVWKSTDLGVSWSPVSAVQNASSTRQVSFTISNNNPISGEFTVSDEASALPVELRSFTAEQQNSTVQLHWTTATETNNYGFEIERKANYQSSNYQIPKFQNSEWQAVGFIHGHGTTHTPNEYTFSDNVTMAGNFFYRLKQIDRDGAFSYSHTVEMSVAGTPHQFALEQNYPNPFNPSTLIRYQLSARCRVTLKIYDVLGKEISVLVKTEQEPGDHTAEFNASGYPGGVYFYTLQAGEYFAAKKMLMVK